MNPQPLPNPKLQLTKPIQSVLVWVCGAGVNMHVAALERSPSAKALYYMPKSPLIRL